MKPDFEAYAGADRAPALPRHLRAASASSAPTASALIVLVCVLSPRRARVGHLPRRRRVLRAVAGAGRRASSSARASPSCSTPRAPTSTCRSWRSCCGPPRSRRARRAAACRSWRCWPWPACCAPRRGCWPAPTGCGAARRRAGPARARRCRAAGVVPGRPVGHRRPALLAARHQRPRRRAQPQPRAVRGPRLVRVVPRPTPRARRSRSPPRPERCCCGGCAPGRALHVPIALFGAGVVTFLATGLAGLSVLPRYLTVPVVAVCLVAGYGVLGFTTLPAGRVRRLWSRAAIAAAALGLVFVAIKAPRRRHAARRAALHQGLARRPRGASCTRRRSSATCAAAR